MELSAGDFRIVYLCGSAGALQAYLEILRSLPDDPGMAFVVIAHRGAQNPDLLPALLSGATKMQVVEVRQDMAIQPNTVYVCPPLKDTLFEDSRFQLRPSSKPFGWPQTITVLLNSAAATGGHRIVAVILSGMGEDGSAALAAIKARGGLVFAQSDAPYESMPKKAMETGHVDRVLSATQIGAELRALAAHSDRVVLSAVAGACPSEMEDVAPAAKKVW